MQKAVSLHSESLTELRAAREGSGEWRSRGRNCTSSIPSIIEYLAGTWASARFYVFIGCRGVCARREACVRVSTATRTCTNSRGQRWGRSSRFIFTRKGRASGSIVRAAFEEIERLDETLSNYKPESELSRINRLAGHETVTTDPEMFALLRTCLEYSRRSGGRLTSRWGR